MKQDIHIFQGMRRDNHPIRQESKFLWDAHNIRFTARDDNTLLSMTNEKGTKLTDAKLQGKYVGHCIVGNYLIVFTEWEDSNGSIVNDIFRVSKNDDTWECKMLYRGNLNMEPSHLAQTLGIYEGDLVQKVYWVDGVNQPRVINVVADKLLSKEIDVDNNEVYYEGCFDFVQELQLKEEVTVKRVEGGGSFSPGTMQYAFSYYNRYGQESNLFYVTELYNTSFITRGGSPEEAIANTFHITINNIETTFQYLRIYSIHRTSLNSTPTVKIVTDIEISDSSITYIDTGLTGTDIDPTKMLYIGGESISAGTITEKDNTLFLGNIELKRYSIPDSIKTKLKEYVKTNKITLGRRTIELKSIDDTNAVYRYSNQLAVGNTSTFKNGDIYRLGVQFQHKSGKWSEPCWLGDYQISGNKPYISKDDIIIPNIEFNLDSDIVESLKALDYKKVRSLVVLPTIYDRMVLAQGILCPTVFSIKDRISNTPFAQSSWFFRPMSDDNYVDNSKNINKGATVTFKHLEPLCYGSDRGTEIQNMTGATFSSVNRSIANGESNNLNTFFVDQSIITLHSPDIEFDDSTKQALEGNDFDLSIVGLVDFKSTAGDISIQTSSTVPASIDNGFFHKSFLNTDYENRGMVAGLFYRSHMIDENKNASEYYAYKRTDPNYEMCWLVYPWHRSGSLNNDIVRPDGKGTRTSVLKRKVISNIRFSPDTIWLSSEWKPSEGITPVSIFDSNEVSLVKIPIPKNSNIKTLNYYGNLDTLITTNKSYSFYIIPNVSSITAGDTTIALPDPFSYTPLQSIKDDYTFEGDYAEELKEVKEPVRMKYKSTAHAVFAFNYLSNNSPVILPSLDTYINKCNVINVTPFWSSISESSTIYDNVSLAGVEDFSTTSGTSSEIETAIMKKLAAITNSYNYAICNNSTYPTDTAYADLYQRTGLTEIPWAKVTLTSDMLNKVYKYSDKESYWQVQAENGTYYLRKIDSSLVYTVRQDNINPPIPLAGNMALLYMAELKRKEIPDNIFGGDTEEALRNNSWIPSGPSVDLSDIIYFNYGDTYFQRYDCLKTYPFTTEDENSVVEIASFMCESRVNLDGRYDRNRGQLSNLNMSPTNFNLLNPIYSQKDNFFNYRILDKQYYRNIKYPTQVLWSLEKTYLEDVDTWTNVTLANSIDLSGSAGPVTSIETYNDLLIAFQEKSISQVLFNNRVQMPTSDGTPIEISNNYKVEGARLVSDSIGCQNKWSITKSSSGLYFVDNTTDTLYLYNGQLQDLSTQLGGKYWMRENHTNEDSFIRLSYDPKNKDLYLSPDDKESLCYSEQLGQFTSLMSYNNAIMFPMNNEFLSLHYDTSGETWLWENFKGDYNSFYGKFKMPSFTYICNEDSTYTKIFDTIEYRADVYDKDGNLSHNRSFDWIEAANEYQDSGVKALSQSRRVLNDTSLRKKFRVWRGQVPRQDRERIRNPWASISLGFNASNGEDENKFHFILHDISTKYTI